MKAITLWVALIPLLPSVAAVYEVGPAKSYSNIGDVAWETLQPGDTVLIHYRSQPYHEKWVICRQGTESDQITIRGVPDASGRLPVISGSNATTRLELDYWNEDRSIIKIGGASVPPDTMPRYIVIENLEIRSGRPPYAFTNDNGSAVHYIKNASAIFVEKGEHITLRNCVFRDCGNGLFTASQSSDLVVEKCHLYDNGNVGSAFEHNSYTESSDILFQYNYYGPLRAGCDGNNLKDRSKGCVVRYNWIESGNRQLDLVDSSHSTFYNAPDYRSTYVYGNILIEPDGAGNSQICHYGGDSGMTSRYRKGVLYFYNNTVVSTRTGNTTLFRLSTEDETVECRNNIFYVTATGNKLAVLSDDGTANLVHNWLNQNWRISHGNPVADVNEVAGNLTGSSPGFVDVIGQGYSLFSTGAAVNAGTDLDPNVLPDFGVTREYMKHQTGRIRRYDGQFDLGALEAILDSDEDFIPDWWEFLYFTGTTNAISVLDADSDGMSNLDEYIADTVPTNDNSFFVVTGIDSEESGQSVTFTSSSNRNYSLQFHREDGMWSNVLSGIDGRSPAMSLSNAEEFDHGFFRVLVNQP